MFKNAIVRKPCPSMVNGLRDQDHGDPDFELAVKQHTDYCSALRQCGLEITELESMNQFPDSVFIEDNAVLTRKCAIVARPGADSRRNETEGLVELLSCLYESVYEITAPGTLDGGDVMMVGDYYYIGLSERTNLEGARQFIEFLKQHDMDGDTIQLEAGLHLKSSVSYLEHNQIVVTEPLTNHPLLSEFEKIIIESEEAYAANSVWINDSILVPSGFPQSASAISESGLSIIELDTSEFRKLDGGLSCLSLRF